MMADEERVAAHVRGLNPAAPGEWSLGSDPSQRWSTAVTRQGDVRDALKAATGVSGEVEPRSELAPHEHLNSSQNFADHSYELPTLSALDTRENFLQAPSVSHSRISDLRPPSSDSQIAEPVSPEKFNTKSTYTSFGLISAYVALNASVAHTLRDNPAAAIPVIYNLTGYLPQLAAQAYDSYKHDEALVLDSTMYIKIIGAGVVSGVQVASGKYPHEMGLEGKNKTAVAAAWTMAAATATDIAGRAIRRLTQGKPTVYSTMQESNPRDADGYISYVDHLARTIGYDVASRIKDTAVGISDRLIQRPSAAILPTSNQEARDGMAISTGERSELRARDSQERTTGTRPPLDNRSRDRDGLER